MSELLSIRDADIFRGRTKVFENLTLTIDTSQNTAIVGPNGAGKTTLLKVLAREIYPSQGMVSIFGKQHWNVWDLRKRFGIVSNDLQQNYSKSATGFQVILSGYHASTDVFGHQNFQPDQIDFAKQISHEMGVDHLNEKQFSKMSTGEQRRHLLGRALVNDPDALVLDEPTSGLDIPAMFRYVELIQNLIAAGKTIILVTHHINEIPPEIQTIILMENGKVKEVGNKQSVLTCEILSRLFKTNVKVLQARGYYSVIPGD
ncbi:MAG: ATP-binding cassette domain-containing protein [Planctomycetota bacterium]